MGKRRGNLYVKRDDAVFSLGSYDWSGASLRTNKVYHHNYRRERNDGEHSLQHAVRSNSCACPSDLCTRDDDV